jgi:hypothetical protein
MLAFKTGSPTLRQDSQTEPHLSHETVADRGWSVAPHISHILPLLESVLNIMDVLRDGDSERLRSFPPPPAPSPIVTVEAETAGVETAAPAPLLHALPPSACMLSPGPPLNDARRRSYFSR